MEGSSFIQSLGLQFSLPLSSMLSLDPALDFFYDEYMYQSTLERAVMTPIESSSAFGPLSAVMGISLNLPLSLRLPLSQNLSLILQPGFSFHIRIPVLALDASDPEDLGLILDDLNAYGRWIYLSLGTGLEARLSENTSFEVLLRALLPVSRIWDPRKLPLYDGMLVWASAGLRFSL